MRLRGDDNEQMIREQIVARGVSDPRVLDAFRTVPREIFVPPNHRASAYDDTPLPLVRGQTISQPFIVAFMTEQLRLNGDEKVLEIGTGSGYQTAILARLAKIVYSAEVEPELAETARERIEQLGITNVVLGTGNGVELFREHAPFDAILSAAAPEYLPESLVDQLADGGRCIIPVGAADLQHLWLIERRGGHVTRRRLEAVRFVPPHSEIVTARRTRLFDRHPVKIRHDPFESFPDPDREELRGGVLEAGDVVEEIVVELFDQGLDGALEVGEIDHPAELGIEGAAHRHLASKGVAVDAPALVAFRNLR